MGRRRRLILLIGSPCNDLESLIRQWPLQCPRLIPWRTHPYVALLISRQDHWHGFGMGRLDDGVRLGRQEAVEQMAASTGVAWCRERQSIPSISRRRRPAVGPRQAQRIG